METTASDRQSLIDIAITALGSAAAVFALVRKNNVSLTARLAEGSIIAYDAADILAPDVRRAYIARRISPATDVAPYEYNALLIATGSDMALPPVVSAGTPGTPDSAITDSLQQAIDSAAAGRPPTLPEQPVFLTNIFQNTFDDVFA